MSNTMDKIEDILEESFAIATGKTSPDKHIEEAMDYAKKKISCLLPQKNTVDRITGILVEESKSEEEIVITDVPKFEKRISRLLGVS